MRLSYTLMQALFASTFCSRSLFGSGLMSNPHVGLLLRVVDRQPSTRATSKERSIRHAYPITTPRDAWLSPCSLICHSGCSVLEQPLRFDWKMERVQYVCRSKIGTQGFVEMPQYGGIPREKDIKSCLPPVRASCSTGSTAFVYFTVAKYIIDQGSGTAYSSLAGAYARTTDNDAKIIAQYIKFANGGHQRNSSARTSLNISLVHHTVSWFLRGDFQALHAQVAHKRTYSVQTHNLCLLSPLLFLSSILALSYQVALGSPPTKTPPPSPRLAVLGALPGVAAFRPPPRPDCSPSTSPTSHPSPTFHVSRDTRTSPTPRTPRYHLPLGLASRPSSGNSRPYPRSTYAAGVPFSPLRWR
jgi:hypothetical protein